MRVYENMMKAVDGIGSGRGRNDLFVEIGDFGRQLSIGSALLEAINNPQSSLEVHKDDEARFERAYSRRRLQFTSGRTEREYCAELLASLPVKKTLRVMQGRQ